MRIDSQTYYLLGDHLTSTAITLDSAGNRLNSNTKLRYYPYGAARYDTLNQQTIYRYTGQRVETGTGLYDYGARWFDPLIGRFLSADTIVPEPGDSQALNRYSYVLNNPLRYTDPTGHFSEEDICTYWGYCGESAVLAGLGERLFTMLWKTAITWGDLMFMGNGDGADTVGMFVLMANEHEGTFRYRAGLWGVRGDRYGKPIDWESVQASGQLGAYDREHNVWEGMARQDAEAWAGRIPSASSANNLGLAPGMLDYQFGNYIDLNGRWLVAAGVTVAAWWPGGLAALGASALIITVVQWGSIAVDVAGLTSDVTGLNVLGGPVDATYPAVYYDPLRIGRAPSQLHVKPPRGPQ